MSMYPPTTRKDGNGVVHLTEQRGQPGAFRKTMCGKTLRLYSTVLTIPTCTACRRQSKVMASAS